MAAAIQPGRTTSGEKCPSRIRFRLVVLLWIWAACVYLVLDLFLDVTFLDPVRPRSEAYVALRRAAHRMVGEPYFEDDVHTRQSLPPCASRPLATVRDERFPDGSRKRRYGVIVDPRVGDTLDGPYAEWHENGRKAAEGTFLRGRKHGAWNDWYANGQPKMSVRYIKGRASGPWTAWYENGTKKWEVTFRNGTPVDGEWWYWHATGRRWIMRTYQDGERDGPEIHWDDEGNMTLAVSYLSGKRNGIAKAWDRKRSLRVTEYWNGTKIR